MSSRATAWVVGVGASAGGLNALRALLSNFPDKLGASIVVLQHLDPEHESRLSALLQKNCSLKVKEAKDGDRLTRDTVYVTPPGHYIEIHDSKTLHLISPPEERRDRNPIDHLFRQIAENFGSRAVGIILSGTGGDGSSGIREIKGAGGAVFVQDPESAEFDGMPRAAINTGLVDHVGPPEQVPETVGNLIKTANEVEQGDEEDFAAQHTESFEEILRVLHDENGFDFSEYKSGTIGRRIRRRMGISGINDVTEYIKHLNESGQERDVLIKDLMIGVTRFFRDDKAWEALSETVIRPAIASMSNGDAFRAWVAGCSTGEEAYTLAILIMEAIQQSGKQIKPIIFASDLNEEAIEHARAGRYPSSAVDGMSKDHIRRWFERFNDDVRVRPRLREKLIFAVQNAVTDPPFSGLDLISCRNLLIYLEPTAQKRLFETFHFSLKGSGHLMLGLSEGAERAEPWFTPIDKRHRVFQRTDAPRRIPVRPAGRWPSRHAPPAGQSTHSEVSSSDQAVQAMLKRFAPPAVLVDHNFDVKRFHGNLGNFIDYATGTMSGGLVALLSKPFQSRVWSALNAAKNSEQASETIVLQAPEDEHPIRVIVEPLNGSIGAEYIVYFVETEGPRQDPTSNNLADVSVSEYQQELEGLRHELQAVVEKGESSSEELQAANEEVLSANEELQSSNEELETSREELQSVNEELSTINTELEEKVRELEATNDDLSNLISSTDIATIFLDTDLLIRRFSSKTAELISIRDSDIGRPIIELNLKVDDARLVEDSTAVLKKLQPIEREISGEGYAYLRRIVPYRTQKDQIQGVVVTFSNILKIRLASEKLSVQAQRQATIAELGELALSPGGVNELFSRIAQDVSEQLSANVVEIEMMSPDKSSFQLVAGEGWPRGVAGHASSPNDPENHLGYSIRHGKVVEISDFSNCKKFSPTAILADRSVSCGVCLPIGTQQAPVGVLGAWRDHDCNFDIEEKDFLRAVAKILWLAVHHAESKRQRDRETLALQDLMDGLPVVVALVDKSFRFSMSNRAFERMGLVLDEVRDATVESVFGTSVSEALHEATAEETEGAVRFEVELPIPMQGNRTFLMHCAPRRIADDLEGYYIAAIDIDERKRWEERNKVISAELDHRVKNILALVNSIARMTGRNTDNINEFRAMFSERIQSLSRTHSSLARKDWDGLQLNQLLRNELEAYASDEIDQFSIQGPPIHIGPSATQSLGLAVHEMTTNAVKYGALSVPGGQLKIKWEIDVEHLKFSWVESGVKSVSQPKNVGFGSSVIRSAIETQLDGKFEVHYEPTGIQFSMIVPLISLQKSQEAS